MEIKEFFEGFKIDRDGVLWQKAKKAVKIAAIAFVGIVFLIGTFLFYLNHVDFAPLMEEELHPSKRLIPEYIEQRQLSFLTWNIGHGNLGNSMAFFNESGKKVRATKSATQNGFEQIVSRVLSLRNTDFILLQEVDFDSKRTHFINQYAALSNAMFFHESVFALNYSVPYVPLPLTKPLGKVNSGQMTLSRFASKTARRISYPQIALWPGRLFLHDRCVIETRYPIKEGGELVVFNTHNSDFVKDDQNIDLEIDVLRKRMIKEYEKGNFVLVGGDWNVNPPDFEPSRSYDYLYKKTDLSFPKNMIPTGWQFAYSNLVPTSRFSNTPFSKSKTYTTTTDYFIVSPNIEIIHIEVLNLEFESSNHNPILLKISLK
ncbi:MAG: endonuclease/exonuclease/phosphatase family protein [Lentimicrobiaceae bacterium]|nr:endonuclease/exonuclease/phosphatase family protein [Lentimicrobiaceae bacterium]